MGPPAARGRGVVTPGTTSMGRPGDAAAGGGFARVTGLGATALGASGSVAGASSGGGSCANAVPAQMKTTANDHTVTARAIGHVSHYKEGCAEIEPPHFVRSVARPRLDAFFADEIGAGTPAREAAGAEEL
jgi:hypothetical protein